MSPRPGDWRLVGEGEGEGQSHSRVFIIIAANFVSLQVLVVSWSLLSTVLPVQCGAVLLVVVADRGRQCYCRLLRTD